MRAKARQPETMQDKPDRAKQSKTDARQSNAKPEEGNPPCMSDLLFAGTFATQARGCMRQYPSRKTMINDTTSRRPEKGRGAMSWLKHHLHILTSEIQQYSGRQLGSAQYSPHSDQRNLAILRWRWQIPQMVGILPSSFTTCLPLGR